MVTTADSVAAVVRGAPLTELRVNVTIAMRMAGTTRAFILNSPLTLTGGFRTCMRTDPRCEPVADEGSAMDGQSSARRFGDAHDRCRGQVASRLRLCHCVGNR